MKWVQALEVLDAVQVTPQQQLQHLYIAALRSRMHCILTEIVQLSVVNTLGVEEYFDHSSAVNETQNKTEDKVKFENKSRKQLTEKKIIIENKMPKMI